MAGGVLVAHDLSPDSGKVIDVGRDLAARLGLSLTILHVVTSKELESGRHRAPDEEAFVDVVLERVGTELREDLSARWGDDAALSAAVRILHGEPEELILQSIDKGQFAFAVIGVRARSRVGKLLFGSVAQSTLLRSACPVVAVPTGP